MIHRAAALSQGPLLWSGEHWILYLRPPGAEADSGQLSLYYAAYSPAGRGTVAYIDIPGSEGLAAVCTDNPDLADFITATMIRGSNNPFDRDLPQWPATFSRAGRIDRNPSWTIQSEHHTPDRHLGAIGKPSSRPTHHQSPYRLHGADFCRRRPDATRRHDRTRLPLSPRCLEQKLGQARSSCCFALAETMVAVHLSSGI